MKTLIATTLAAAAITAAPASAAPVSITPSTGAEGAALSVPVSHACGVKKGCRYTITTADGTATADADYTAVDVAPAGKTKKGRTFAFTVPIETVDDDDCEPDETFTVHVEMTNRKGTYAYDGTQTITDDDCDEAAPPGVPAPPEGSGVSNLRTDDGAEQTCVTREDYASSSAGFDPCTVYVRCPETASSCSARGSSEITTRNSDKPYLETRAYDRVIGGPAPFFNGPCGGFGGCRMETFKATVQPGQYYVVNCVGAQKDKKANPDDDRPLPARASIRCTAKLTY